LSRLIVESLLTQAFREKLEIRFSHYNNFDELPGRIIFMMTLDTCNASAEMDIDEAKEHSQISTSTTSREKTSLTSQLQR
jgi:hypothetical protein